MTLYDWIPSLTSTSLLALALWLGQRWISERLTSSIKHESDVKIERLRADLRRSEEQFRVDHQAREVEIAALQGGALSALAGRQQLLDKRRLEAVDQLWESFIGLATARGIAIMMSRLKYDTAAEEAERNPRFRQLFETLTSGFDPKVNYTLSAQHARPFLSPAVWATFSAYSSVCLHAAARATMLKSGLKSDEFFDLKAVNRLIILALPHFEAYINEHGRLVDDQVLEALEEMLVKHIDDMLQGVEASEASVVHASKILAQAREVQNRTVEIQRQN